MVIKQSIIRSEDEISEIFLKILW